MKLLLDEHISPSVVEAVKRLNPLADIRHMTALASRGLPDPDLLRLARAEDVVLVTFDTNTMPRHIRDFIERGENFGGVILVSTKTIAHEDVGRLARALVHLETVAGAERWSNRVQFLKG